MRPPRSIFLAFGLAVLAFSPSLCVGQSSALPPDSLVPTEAAAIPASPGLPPGRLAMLAHGINLNDWFSPWATPSRYATGFSVAEATFLKKAGFTVCRLPLAPNLLFDPAHPGEPKAEIRYVDRAVRLLLDAGLAVVLDPIHGASSSDEWESSLDHDPGFLRAAEAYWEALARHFSALSGDRIFFEVMNEPHLSAREKISPDWWQAVQEALAAAIRRGAPTNTIVATGELWGGIDGLLRLKPLRDPDVVYSFHWYEPFTFTHQGATWTAPVQAELAGIPYPSSPATVAAVAETLSDQKARKQVLAYGEEAWDEARIGAALQRATDWAAANHVRLFCGEFGVYRKVAPIDDRLRWIRDVRQSLESLGVGWSMWDYETDFGLVTFAEPSWRRGPVVDSLCLTALGLDDSQNLAADSLGATAAAFSSGAAQSLQIPVWAWKKLWTRESGAGDVTVKEDANLTPVRESLVLRGLRDWSLASGLLIPVRSGEELALASDASLEGTGSLSLELIARDAAGKVLKWDYAAVKVDVGPSTSYSTHFVVAPGIATLEPRWSGSGPAQITVGGFYLSR